MHKTRQWITAYVACVGAFLLLDACWLTLMADRLYRPALGALMRPDFDLLAAALFYPLYLAGVVGFVVVPALAAGKVSAALARGAAFGFICYATYDLTNQATLIGWPWHITVVDLIWGSTVTATAALAAFLAAKRFSDPDQ